MTSHAIQPAAMRTGLKTHYIGTLSKIEIYMEITRAWGIPLSKYIYIYYKYTYIFTYRYTDVYIYIHDIFVVVFIHSFDPKINYK